MYCIETLSMNEHFSGKVLYKDLQRWVLVCVIKKNSLVHDFIDSYVVNSFWLLFIDATPWEHDKILFKWYCSDIICKGVKEANVKIANFNVSQLCPKNVFTLKLPKPCYMYYV